MKTVHTTERTGKDGVLNVRIPLGQPDAEFDVTVLLEPTEGSANGTATDEWPPGYFDLAGSITDEKFDRPPQGRLPPAAEI